MYYLTISRKKPWGAETHGEFENDLDAQRRAEEIAMKGYWVGEILYLPSSISKITIMENGTGDKDANL